MLPVPLRSATVLLGLLAVACTASGPGPGAVRLAEPEVSGGHHLGSPLSGSLAGLQSAPPLLRRLPDGAQGLVVTGAACLVGAESGAALDRLQARATLIAAPLEAEPLQVDAELLAPLRVGLVDPFYDWLDDQADVRPLQEVRGVLEPGTTFTLRVDHPAPEGDQQLRSYELSLASPHDGRPPEVALACTLHHPEGQALAWEQAMLDALPDAAGPALVLLAPTPSPRHRLLLALVVDAVPAGPDLPGLDERGPLAAAARRETEAGWRRQVELLQAVTAAFTGRPDLAAGVSGLTRETTRRSALLYLAGELAAPAADDMALTGRDDLIAALALEVERGLPALAPDDEAGLAHLLQAGALTVLARATDAGEGDLLMEALLLRHTGELGRHPARLLELLGLCSGSSDLEAVLLAENRLFLEDNAPAARVRAYDWLLVHGQAPAGYDPLGDRASRRAALLREVTP